MTPEKMAKTAPSTTPRKKTAPATTSRTPVAKRAGPAQQVASAKKPSIAKTRPDTKTAGAGGKPVSRRVLAKSQSAHRSKFFAKAQQRGSALLKEPEKLLVLAAKASRKSQSFAKGPLADMVDELKALLRLIRAFAKGQYRDISKESMVIIVGAVLYVVSPIDLIPDVIPVAGLLDDATVLAFALKMVREEVQEFLDWEAAQGT